MFIGNELLPNVYIENIEVYESKIRYDIFILDSASSPAWSKKKSLVHTLKLKHTIIEDSSERENLISGVAIFNKNHSKANVNLVSEMKHGLIDNIANFEDRIYFIKTFEYEIHDAPKNLSIFANLFIDGIEEEGPLTAEDVYINGVLSETTNVFTKNGLPYYGPVHEHEGIYMEGKYHSSEPHSVIDILPIANIKIKDFRKHIYPNRLFNENNDVPLFSELFISFDNDTNHNFMFFINLRITII
jgi:hypothetical protein